MTFRVTGFIVRLFDLGTFESHRRNFFRVEETGRGQVSVAALKAGIELPVSTVALTIVFVTLASKQDGPLDF